MSEFRCICCPISISTQDKFLRIFLSWLHLDGFDHDSLLFKGEDINLLNRSEL